jgi:hypothetical protein
VQLELFCVMGKVWPATVRFAVRATGPEFAEME